MGTKLATAMLVVLSAVTAATYYQTRSRDREQLLGAKQRAAAMVVELFSASVTAPLSFDDEPGVREQLALLARQSTVVDAEVWSAVGGDTAHGRVTTLRRDDKTRTAPAAHRDVRIEPRADEVMVEHPVVSGSGELLGMTRVTLSLAAEKAAIEAARTRTLATTLALALALGIVITLLTRTLIVRRLARLGDAAKRLEEGTATTEVDETANDEVGNLARAFVSMRAAIQSREARITARNHDLRRVLDNMADGLMTVDLEGRMSSERSGIIDDWFGAPPESLELFEYFGTFAAETAEWLRLGWLALRDDLVPVEVVLDQLPRRFIHDNRSFALEYRPIWARPEVLDRVLVVVRDVTSVVERERAEQAQREAMAIFRRVLGDREGWSEFVAETSRLVEDITSYERRELDAVRLAREIHTLKGNTAIFAIESISKLCHQMETRANDEGGPPTAAEIEALRSAWKVVLDLHEQLSGSRSADRVEIPTDDYEQHLAALEQRRPHEELSVVVRTWSDELATTRMQRVTEQARAVARRLGKTDTEIQTVVRPTNLRLPVEKWRPIWTAFGHVLRNTFDHGVEDAEKRVASGKSAKATVKIALERCGAGVELAVSDDGPGIAWDRIKASAAAHGLPTATRADLEEALFADHVSSRTQATETSGRGVGMSAVRETVWKCGGTIVVDSVPGRGTTFRFRFPASMCSASLPISSREARAAS